MYNNALITPIILSISIYIVLEIIRFTYSKHITNRENKIKYTYEERIRNVQDSLNIVTKKNISYEFGGVNFDETKKVLMTMIDEYITSLFRNEINMPHNIRNREKPTTWDGVHVIPTAEKQKEHYKILDELVKTNMSDSFLDRLRVFYKDSYINEFIKEYIRMEYNKRILDTIEDGKVFRELCRKNIEEFRKERLMEINKEKADENKKLNEVLQLFGFQTSYETDPEEIDKAPPMEETDTMKLFRGRYLLDKNYFDKVVLPHVDTIEDTVVDADKFRDADDKLVAYLAKTNNWTKEKVTPEKAELVKYDIAEVCMKHGLNPVETNMFGEYAEAAPFSYEYEDETIFMAGKRLNPMFYSSDIYKEDYNSIEECAFTLNKDILV